MPNIAGKTHNRRHIHLNIDVTEEERKNQVLHIFMPKHSLKKVLNKLKEQVGELVTKKLKATALPINLHTSGLNQTN